MKKIALTYQFSQVDKFFRQLLSDIGGGQIEKTPSFLDLNMIRAAQSVATKRMMMERLHDESGTESPAKVNPDARSLSDV